MSKRAPRADAVRNRARILLAAREAFAEDGAGVALDAIAARAGVGPGTVHRHFPTKDALLGAVIADRLDELADRATRAGGDAAEEFFAFLTELAEAGRANLALAAALGGSLGTQADQAAARLTDAFQSLLAAAQRTGTVRQDLDVSDVHAILAGVLATEGRLPDARKGLGLEIAIAGLRATRLSQTE